MAHVTRLVTYVEVDGDVVDPGQLSVSARHEAVLADGSRVLLLDDRGWSESGPPDVWARVRVDDLEDTARMVVGPDEAFGGRSYADMEAGHWASLAAVLAEQGVEVDGLTLGRIPHDVVLGERLLARLGR